MIKEAYVSFETAKLLKEKGFDEPCNHYYFYRKLKEVHYYERNSECQYLDEVEYCTSPTQQMAMQWLREKGIYICPKYCCFCGSKKKDRPYYKWEARILRLPSNNIIYPQPMDMCEHYPTYEQAVEAALKYSLENLI